MTGLIPFLLLAQSTLGGASLTSPHQTALDLYRKHSYAPAVEAFRKALDAEKPGTPDYDESVLLLGQCLFLLNRPADAIPYLEKAAKTDEALYMLGTACLRTRDLPKAEAAFAALYRVETGSAAAHLLTAQLMMRQDFVAEAEKELEQAIALDPKLPQAHYILGEIRMTQGNPDEAIRLLGQELTVDPNYAMVYYKLGDAYIRKSEFESAVKYLEKSIWLNPAFSGPFILLGKCYVKLNRLPDAEGVLRRAIELDPKNYSAHYLLGQTLVQSGQAEEGKRLLEESQKLRP